MTGFSALTTSSDAEAGAHMQWQGTSKVSGPEWLKMPVLTVGMLGLQIIWSVEMSYASPYLLSLGLSKSFMSTVFLAGPLSGLIVQPLIGVLSDGSHSRFGRRRPYIFFGAFVSFGAMYLLGFTRQFASVITTKGSSANDALTIGLAVWSIYCIDFSINAVQATDRALLVDVLPKSQQEKGNAWAGRMFGLGSVIGFYVGNIDLTQSFSLLGHTQLEVLCVISSCILLLTHIITILNVKERVLRKPTNGKNVQFSLWRVIKDIWANFSGLPLTIKQICLIQLFAWIGWFPVLFWTSLYVGELHKRNSPVPDTDAAQATLDAVATRLGSRALLCNALASLFASVVCPFFVSNDGDNHGGRRGTVKTKEDGWLGVLKNRWEQRRTCHLAVLWAVSHGAFAVCMMSTFFIFNVLAATAVMTLTGFSWAITQWAPFALIAEAIHCASSASSSHYVLGGADEETDDGNESIPLRDTRTNRTPEEPPLGTPEEDQHLIFRDNDEDGDENMKPVSSKRVHFDDSPSDSQLSENGNTPLPSTLLGMNTGAQRSQGDVHLSINGNGGMHIDYAPEDDGVGVSMDSLRSGRSRDERSLDDKAGIILGIHNVFIVIPQFIITGLSSIIFAVMDPGKPVLASHGVPAHPGSLPGGPIGNSTADLAAISLLPPRAEGEAATGANSVGVIFRIGGVSAAIACVLTLRLARELKRTRR